MKIEIFYMFLNGCGEIAFTVVDGKRKPIKHLEKILAGLPDEVLTADGYTSLVYNIEKHKS